MSDYTDFIATLKDWANRQDWSDALVASYVRSAEEKFNQELRIDRMISSVNGTIVSGCAPLPDDWLEFDFVLIANDTTPTGWYPIRYKPRDEFFKQADTPYAGTYSIGSNSTMGFYTIEGRQIFFGGPVDDVDGTVFQLNYYAEVPVFADGVSSWVYTKYQTLYRYAALMHADLHAVGEEQSAANMKTIAEDMIQKLNAVHRYARASGSRLSRSRVRSFG